MSGELRIRFAEDMPPAAVEVVSADFASVGRLWLSAGREQAIQVPAEGSFLRVHLASGRIVNLPGDAGMLDRTIQASMIAQQQATTPERDTLGAPVDPQSIVARTTPRARTRSKSTNPSQSRSREPRSQTDSISHEAIRSEESVAKANTVKRPGSVRVSLKDATNHIPQYSKHDGTVTYRPPQHTGRYILTIDAPIQRLRIRLPGTTRQIVIRSTFNDAGSTVSVRVQTISAESDALSGYLHRGDLYSAASMSNWAERAEEMLEQKMANPFAAAVGAYLLLRVRRIDLLHDWTRNLMDWCEGFSDPLIIRAWHLILTRGEEATIRDLFRQALRRSLPVFSEGLRLLSEGVRLLGEDSDAAVTALNDHARNSVSTSPFTATIAPRMGRQGGPSTFDINYLYDV